MKLRDRPAPRSRPAPTLSTKPGPRAARYEAAQAKAVTFEQAARAYIAAHEAGWRNAKHAQQWRNTLETYAYPVIGALMVRDVELAHVLAVLEPIWRDKTETATRLRGRIELVLDWATARGYRDGLNPARWRGHLDKLLPRPSKVGASRAPRGAAGVGDRRLHEAAARGRRHGRPRAGVRDPDRRAIG